MRGTDYLTGQHTFRLGPGGYELFPRLETTSPHTGDHLSDDRHGFGLPQVDDMSSGGMPAGDAMLKMRRSAHEKGLLQFQISDGGFSPVGQADVASGVLGWTVIGSPVGGT